MRTIKEAIVDRIDYFVITGIHLASFILWIPLTIIIVASFILALQV